MDKLQARQRIVRSKVLAGCLKASGVKSIDVEVVFNVTLGVVSPLLWLKHLPKRQFDGSNEQPTNDLQVSYKYLVQTCGAALLSNETAVYPYVITLYNGM